MTANPVSSSRPNGSPPGTVHPEWSTPPKTGADLSWAGWLLLFGALIAANPNADTPSLTMLVGLATLQIATPRVRAMQTPAGGWAAAGMQIVLCYFLIGYTDAINSSFYPILLLPVVTAATTMSGRATILVTAVAMTAYLSFLLFLDLESLDRYLFNWQELLLRVAFLPLTGYATFLLAHSNLVEAKKYQAAAEELARKNQELLDAETAMRRSERLAALGQLTAGLAHELRNPLGTIRASAEMLRKVAGDAGGGVGREMTDFIVSETDRANSLVTRFLEFARPLPLKPAVTDLHEILDRAVAQFERNPGRPDVSIYKNYDPEIPPVRIDGEWMERVFYNLLTNAAEASAEGSSVTVKTRRAAGFVEVSVIDRGSGIAPEHRESIFNPFFTTKAGGVGLGLAIVSKIVDEHRGRIAVESEQNKGSVFRVLLPG